jgi:DNA-binding response OmpR family regulator
MTTGERPLVLCVEDDPLTLEILSRILARLPVDCALAARPDQAIEIAHSRRPHLVILDLMLPDMSGWEVLDHIRDGSQRQDMRVIVLTAKDSSYERLVATNIAQIDEYVSKPFDTADLLQHVLRLLNLPADEEWLAKLRQARQHGTDIPPTPASTD